jgi:hypothetical protein
MTIICVPVAGGGHRPASMTREEQGEALAYTGVVVLCVVGGEGGGVGECGRSKVGQEGCVACGMRVVVAMPWCTLPLTLRGGASAPSVTSQLALHTGMHTRSCRCWRRCCCLPRVLAAAGVSIRCGSAQRHPGNTGRSLRHGAAVLSAAALPTTSILAGSRRHSPLCAHTCIAVHSRRVA